MNRKRVRAASGTRTPWVPPAQLLHSVEKSRGIRKEVSAESIKPSPENINLTLPAAPLGPVNQSSLLIVSINSALSKPQGKAEEPEKEVSLWQFSRHDGD